MLLYKTWPNDLGDSAVNSELYALSCMFAYVSYKLCSINFRFFIWISDLLDWLACCQLEEISMFHDKYFAGVWGLTFLRLSLCSCT
jgi:hypothetical protein